MLWCVMVCDVAFDYTLRSILCFIYCAAFRRTGGEPSGGKPALQKPPLVVEQLRPSHARTTLAGEGVVEHGHAAAVLVLGVVHGVLLDDAAVLHLAVSTGAVSHQDSVGRLVEELVAGVEPNLIGAE